MDVFQSLAALVSRFEDLGATRIFYKPLAENDNSKQQIYLGGSFDVLNFFRFGAVRAEKGLKEPTFKAELAFFWVGPDTLEKAKGAQLILYPRYPEVRLSGFLAGCQHAPAQHLRPIPKHDRKGADGRILFFGATADGRTFAHLAPAGSALANETRLANHPASGLFRDVHVSGLPVTETRSQLITKLREIQSLGAVPSMRLDRHGNRIPYSARNGGGYTLEALLGIIPNGDSAPDYLGWEIKAFASGYITVMTPEPDGGFYGEHGVGSFVRRYGREVHGKDQIYFTGRHVAGMKNARTAMTLTLTGFDPKKGVITDTGGHIALLDENGTEGATWSYAALLKHWNRKHSSAAYVPYAAHKSVPPAYTYENPVLLGERTDFSRYLRAVSQGQIVFDPGSKIDSPHSKNQKVKARSQFRVGVNQVSALYESFEAVDLSTGDLVERPVRKRTPKK
jgi:hypothetical protein